LENQYGEKKGTSLRPKTEKKETKQKKKVGKSGEERKVWSAPQDEGRGDVAKHRPKQKLREIDLSSLSTKKSKMPKEFSSKKIGRRSKQSNYPPMGKKEKWTEYSEGIKKRDKKKQLATGADVGKKER